MKPWLRRLAKAIGILLLIVIALPVLGIAALQHDSIRSMSVDWVVDGVNDDLAGHIEVDRVEGSLLGHARLRDVQVTDARGNHAAHIDKATVDFSVLRLVSRSISIDDITVEEATAVVRVYEDDVVNWDRVVDPDPEPAPDEPVDWSVDVDTIAFDDVSVAYLDETADIDDDATPHSRWRRERIDDLDEANDGDDLRRRWEPGFAPEQLEALAGPRAPVAAWLTDLEARGQFQMSGFDMEADIAELTGETRVDVLPESIDSSLEGISFAMGRTTLATDVAHLRFGRWLSAEGLAVQMLMSPSDTDAAGESFGAQSEPDPFEAMYVDLGRWQLEDRLVEWTSPDVSIAAPLEITGRIALTPDEVTVVGDLTADDASKPIEAALHIEEYADPTPEYRAALQGDEFDLHAWVDEPDLPAVQTSFMAHVDGRGFEFEELDADIGLRVDDTVVGDHEAASMVADIGFDGSVVDGRQLSARTPYFDLEASFELDLDGRATVTARTTAEDHHRDASAGAFTDLRPDRADVSLHFDASFDPDLIADAPVEAIESVDSQARWDLSDFEFAPLRIGESHGRLDVDVDRLSGEALWWRAAYDLDARGHELEFDDQSLGSFTVRDRGALRTAPLAEEPLEGLMTFENDASLAIRHLRTPDITIDGLDADVRADSHEQKSPVYADIDLSIRGLQTDEAAVADMEAEFDGVVRLADDDRFAEGFDASLIASVSDVRSPEWNLQSAQVQLDDIRAAFRAGPQPLHSLSGTLSVNADQLSSLQMRIAELRDVAADFDLEFGSAQRPQDLLRHLTVSADARATDIELREMDGSVAELSLTTSVDGPFDDPSAEANVDATSLRIATEEFPRASAEASIGDELRSGRAALRVERSGDDGQKYDAQAHFALEPGYEAGELFDIEFGTDRIRFESPHEATLRWTGQRLEADDFVVESNDQSVFVDGYLRPDVDQALEFALDLDIQTLVDGFYLEPFVPPAAGQLRANARLEGTHDSPTAELDAEATDIHYDEVGPFDTDVRLVYGDETLHLYRLDVSAFDEPLLEAGGAFPVDLAMDGDVEVFVDRRSELRMRLLPQQLRQFHRPLPVLNDFGVDGRVGLHLDWTGTLDRPEIDFSVDVRDFQFQGELADEFVSIRELNISSQAEYTSKRHGGDGLQLSTTVVWDEDELFDSHLASELFVEDWLVAFAEGRADTIRWDDEFLALPFELGIRIPSFDLEDIDIERATAQNLEGILDVDVELDGTLGDPQGRAELSVEDFGFSNIRPVDADVSIGIEDHSLHIDQMDLAWRNRDTFSGQGTVPLPIPTLVAGEPVADLPLDFQWDLHEIPIREFDVIHHQLRAVPGVVDAEIRLRGSLREPDAFLRAGLYDLVMDDQQGTFELELTARDDRLELQGGLDRSDRSLVAIDGHAPVLLDAAQLTRGEPWQLPGDIELYVDNTTPLDAEEMIPLYLITDFIADLKGELDFDLEVAGQWDDPSVGGFVELRDGALTVPEFARGFRDIHTRIDIDDETLELSHEMKDGDSSFAMAGSIDHDAFIPGDVYIEAEAEEFNIGGFATDFPVLTSAEATVTGQLLGEPGELDVDVRNMNIELTDEWDRTLHDTTLDPDIVILDDSYRARLAEFADEELDDVDGFDLVVDVDIHPRARAEHPAGYVIFDGELTTELRGPRVAVGGSIDIQDGEVEFLGRGFDIQSGEIIFTGNEPPNPRLLIEAHYYLDRVIVDALGPPAIGEPRIEFHIGGTAEEPTLDFESDPAMTDTEVLFVLMTGRPPDRTDIGRDEGVAERALSAVSGMFLGLLEDQLAGTVPVDVLRLEPASPGAPGGRLELGRYLLDDLFFSWRHEFGAGDDDEAANIFRLEYHFRPRWMLEGRYSDRNEGELNLFWDAL